MEDLLQQISKLLEICKVPKVSAQIHAFLQFGISQNLVASKSINRVQQAAEEFKNSFTRENSNQNRTFQQFLQKIQIQNTKLPSSDIFANTAFFKKQKLKLFGKEVESVFSKKNISIKLSESEQSLWTQEFKKSNKSLNSLTISNQTMMKSDYLEADFFRPKKESFNPWDDQDDSTLQKSLQFCNSEEFLKIKSSKQIKVYDKVFYEDQAIIKFQVEPNQMQNLEEVVKAVYPFWGNQTQDTFQVQDLTNIIKKIEKYSQQIFFKLPVKIYQKEQPSGLINGKYQIDKKLANKPQICRIRKFIVQSKSNLTQENHHQIMLNIPKNFLINPQWKYTYWIIQKNRGLTNILIQFKCMNIFITMYFKKYSLFIVTEELGDSLYGRYLHKTFRKPADDELRSIIYQLFSALKFLKDNGILHCDLKPENILFDKQGQSLKLVDFGSASFCDDCSYFYLQTKPYRAPEITLGESYDFSIDVWSIGCIIYELLTSEILFGYKSSLENLAKAFAINKHFDLKFYNRQKEKQDPIFKQNVIYSQEEETQVIVPQQNFDFEEVLNLIGTNPDLIDLIKRCLKINPIDRITPDEALQHKFLKNMSQFKKSNQQKYFQLISANALSPTRVNKLLLEISLIFVVRVPQQQLLKEQFQR